MLGCNVQPPITVVQAYGISSTREHIQIRVPHSASPGLSRSQESQTRPSHRSPGAAGRGQDLSSLGAGRGRLLLARFVFYY